MLGPVWLPWQGDVSCCMVWLTVCGQIRLDYVRCDCHGKVLHSLVWYGCRGYGNEKAAGCGVVG
jgi:hypothetical protein